MLEAQIAKYFEETKFSLHHERNVDQLRKAMNIVYTRKTPLISLDMEVHELAQNKVTEVGVSVFDPTNQALLMTPHIKTFHLITKEYSAMRNRRFVPDNKFRFNGKTAYVLPLKQQSQFLEKFFQHAFNEHGAALVGHHVKGDIKWMRSLGVSIDPENIIDTEEIYSFSRQYNRSLRDVLHKLGILHANLHNAANDAYYTLLAAFGLLDPAQRQRLLLDQYSNKNPYDGKTKKERDSIKRFLKFRTMPDIVTKEEPMLSEFAIGDLVEHFVATENEQKNT